MKTFQGKKYELMFSNDLAPFWALLYADSHFFKAFKSLCGGQYHIISINVHGWQKKYVATESLDNLAHILQRKINSRTWLPGLQKKYVTHLNKTKRLLSVPIGSKLTNQDLFRLLQDIRRESTVLDAMSNMLHIAANVLESDFQKRKRLSQFARYVKDDVSGILLERRKVCKNIFRILARSIGIAPRDFEFLTLAEIWRVRAKRPLQTLAAQRRRMSVIVHDGRYHLYEGRSASSFLQRGQWQDIPESIGDSARGMPVMTGKVRGMVVRAMTISQGKKNMRQSRILIAPYTGPEYVPLMKMARAIVTDTGGITAHAAIVSRELKIPCIVGTKIATKIFKDGDRVEVDAIKGIVKKL